MGKYVSSLLICAMSLAVLRYGNCVKLENLTKSIVRRCGMAGKVNAVSERIGLWDNHNLRILKCI